MNSEKKDKLSRKATNEIFAVILEEYNGYSPEEIKNNKLAEDCEGSQSWQKIHDIIHDAIDKK